MIHITQCLCPLRHAILALAWDDETDKQDDMETALRATVESLIQQRRINRVCDMCHSSTFTYETGKTVYKTLAEAMPHLKATEAANIVANQLHHITKGN